MPLKHIDDMTLQEIAQNESLYSKYAAHLSACETCRQNLEFYRQMFPVLSQKLEGNFSPDFAANLISQVTYIEERTRKLKSVFSFLIIIVLSVMPFIIFPDSLSQVTILGESFSKFFSFVRNAITGYNFPTLSIAAVVLLIAFIQLYEYLTRNIYRRKR